MATMQASEDPIDRLFEVLRGAGGSQYGQERVTQLAHALQCATLAERMAATIRRAARLPRPAPPRR